ncbi:elongator complex protein 6 isoform X1 [Sesamum indicum]|uniref:Elongator complex protein 6 isoform X1 n=1 Tax=Sesamum indicum TaxID=4182 RepID=A0A6I9T8X4_SESIN|nr:elongator complex protein 6 isoform X1 [Sesamum indicum]
MANAPPSTLLDEALDGKGAAVFSTSPAAGGRMILVEDCVETSGAFVVHHLLKRCLSPHSSDVVVFLSFANPFSHYDRILRKMGCNLSVQRDNKRLMFLDMLMLERLGRDRGKTSEDVFIALFGEIQKAVELSLSHAGRQHITVIIDDVSLMEVDANGSSNLVLDFLHYCSSLTAQFQGCSLITLNHDDVYSNEDRPGLLLKLEYLADVVIKVEPFSTGLATDVHGQLTVSNKGIHDGSGKSRNKVHNFHFRIKDSSVEYFYPGSKT